jgi:hypothetical protein
MSSTPKYLIVKGCAGIGNRLVTIYASIKYSEKTNRKLIIDWEDGQFDVKGINAFDKCFDLNFTNYIQKTEIQNWNSLSHSSALFKANREAGVYDLYFDKQNPLLLKLPNRLFFNEALRKLCRRWQPISHGNYFNSLAYGSDLSKSQNEGVLYYVDFLPFVNYNELPKLVSIKEFLQKKINNFSLANNISNAIGIHIRYTDKKPSADILKAIEFFKQKHNNSLIYLATDSVVVEMLFKENFNQIILFPKYSPQLNGEGLHQWALYQQQNNLKYQMFEESIIEMFVLSKCQTLYYQGNSTFSNISRVYHQNKKNCYDWTKL